MRVASLLIGVVAAIAVIGCCWPAYAEETLPPAPPAVKDKGGGAFAGIHTYTDDKRVPPRREKRATAPDSRRSSTEDPNSSVDPCATDPSCTINVGTHGLERDDVERYVRRLIVQLQLPKPTPQFGPDPSVNEWKMAAVGYPIWLWTEGPTTVTSTESGFGYTFTLRAVYQSTTFDMGDGHTKRCTRTTPYRISTKPGAASPTCGYTYLKAASNGSYTVTATTHWDVHWSVAGLSGTLPGTHSDSRDLRVGELQAIVVG